MIYYSPSMDAFFHESHHGKSIPKDALKISLEQYRNLTAQISMGKVISVDEKGSLVAVDRPPAPRHELLDQAKNELRTMRRDMLDALTGIAGRAARSGNSALADEADSMAAQLLDITDDEALNNAQSSEEMADAGVAAYKRIAATANPALRVVFREITGA